MPEGQLIERTIEGLHETLLHSLPDMSYDTPVLDIGCGTGAWLERLANAGFTNLYGIDKYAEQIGTKKATCWAADIDWDNNLGLGDRKFGLITAIEVVEHLENPGRLYYYVSKHLDERGYFLMTTPNIHSIDSRLKFMLTGRLKSFDYKGDRTHISPVLLTCMERMLPRHSLQIVKKWGYPNRGSLVSRPSTKMISALFKSIFKEEYYGDTLCLLLRNEKC